jgi:hypothetical protein
MTDMKPNFLKVDEKINKKLKQIEDSLNLNNIGSHDFSKTELIASNRSQYK